MSHSLQAQPSAASPASTVEDAPARSPYLLRDFVKVEELEMLYAEFCLGTRATEEPSVTWGQRWCEQPVMPERHRRRAPQRGESSPGGMKLHCTHPRDIHLLQRRPTYLPCNRSGAGVRTGTHQKP